ncbi:MAG: DUF559 domain-containing protein [Candidatus Micrarchaeota archaeon]|nr:DUF559 domain-containing protein [Candidatus Micrarchaeota archaeon]
MGRIQSKASREKESNTLRQKWKNPLFRDRMISIFSSEKVREKRSKSLSGRNFSAETREKMRKAKINFKNSEVAKLKMSVSHKGLKQTESSKVKISSTLKKYLSKNSAARLRLTTLPVGRVVSQETRLKLHQINIGKKHTELTKTKIRMARLKQIIPAKDTSLERRFQKALTEVGVYYRTHVNLIGQPDIFIEPNICVFLDGCYWHGCQTCNFCRDETLNIKRVEKDRRVNEQLISEGYKVLRFWEHDIDADIDSCVKYVLVTL